MGGREYLKESIVIIGLGSNLFRLEGSMRRSLGRRKGRFGKNEDDFVYFIEGK